MTGKTNPFLYLAGFILVALGFFLVPKGETSGKMDIVEGITPIPPAPPSQVTTFSPVTPVDVSNPDLRPMQITSSQCCSYAGWSADSGWILYLDGRKDEVVPGLYSVPRNGGKATLVTTRYGAFSPDWSHVAYLEGGQVYLERWATNSRWTVPSSGRAVSIAPDLELIAWEFGSQRIQSPDRKQSQVWVSRIDGEGARELVTLHGGEFQGWANGSDAIIATGRLAPTLPAGIWRIDTATGAGQLLFEVERARALSLSPSGEWLALIVAFESQAGRNGIWVLKTDGSFSQRLRGFGSYRWRSDGQLLLIPFDLEAENPGLYQIDLFEGKVWRLIDPNHVELEITNNDWSVSPDGNWLLYQSANDRNLWVVQLPEPPNSP